MDIKDFVNFLPIILSGLFSVVWYLLRKKDEQQEEQIRLLFLKHDEDVKRLQDLELDIAKKHYVKEELDRMFDKLEKAVKDGFDTLGKKFDNLGQAFTDHMRDDLKKP